MESEFQIREEGNGESAGEHLPSFLSLEFHPIDFVRVEPPSEAYPFDVLIGQDAAEGYHGRRAQMHESLPVVATSKVSNRLLCKMLIRSMVYGELLELLPCGSLEFEGEENQNFVCSSPRRSIFLFFFSSSSDFSKL
jgi:hypothetical protein